MKLRCSTCREEKNRREFPRNRARKTGIHNECRLCMNARRRDYHTRVGRERYLRLTYGISPAEYGELLKAQGGKCAICRELPTPRKSEKGTPYALHVDHDHETGAVRGLLCFSCNAGLGKFKERRAVLENAVAYVADWS